VRERPQRTPLPRVRIEKVRGSIPLSSTEFAPESLTWAFMFLRCASPVFVAMEELRSASGSRGITAECARVEFRDAVWVQGARADRA
jgi:hypothetical protein